MTELVGHPGVMMITLQVTRKDTGKVEEYQLVGRMLEQEDPQDGSDAQHSGEERRD